MISFQDKAFLIKINNLFQNELNIAVKIGFEQEFYLGGNDINYLREQYSHFAFYDEDGDNQFEAVSSSEFEVLKLCEQIINFRENSNNIFLSKPFDDQPGSALNLSVSLWREGRNLFAKNTNGQDSMALIWALSGLEDFANDFMYLYAPSQNSYERFKIGKHRPSKICWGYNNRTVAFRVPSIDPNLIRIENRIISSDACPIAATCATLYSIYHGIKNKLTINHKIYGDANNEQYQLIKLIDNYEEALSRFVNFKILSF